MIRFGDHALDPEAFELRRGGEVVQLQPKVFDVLTYLVRERGRVVSKRELLDELWPGEHVNESAVPWSISHARRAIAQQRGDKGPIETVHGRGYRFTGRVVESALPPPAPLSESQPPPPPLSASPPPPAPRLRVPAPALPPQDNTPIVGRETVLARLHERLEQLPEGHGQLVLLAGEAGIGKTRCATEVARAALARDITVWIGRCVDVVGAPVFWPWIQLLRVMSQERPALAERCQALLSQMLTIDELQSAGDEDTQVADGGTAGRFWLLDGVSQLFQDAAADQPLMLVLDDLHWADASSLDLLAFLAPELSRAPLLVVGTLRDEIDEEAETRLRRIARHAERIPLARLHLDDVRSYIATLTGAEPEDTLVEAVLHATVGNPLFLRETMRALIATHGREATARLAPAEVRPPEVARDVLRTRLEALDEAERELLSVASVLGEEFELSILREVAGAEPHELLERLEVSVRAGLLEAPAPHRYRFTHGLIRSVLYADLPTPRRVALHRSAGEALSALSAGEPRHAEIAYHFHHSLAAGDYAKVASHARRAAEAARRVFGHVDAITYYEWALEAQALDASATPRHRAALLLACGAAQRRAGRDWEARATLSRMVETARQHGYADQLLLAARVLRPTQAMSAVPDPMLRDAMEEVLRIVPDTANAERIGALSQLACLPPYSHDMARSKEMSGRALALAREFGERRSLLEAMRARLYSLSGVDDVDAQLSLCDELSAAGTGDETWMSSDAATARYAALLLRGDTDASDRALAEMGRVTDRLQWPEWAWYRDRLAAQRVAMLGDFDEADKRYRKLLTRGKKMRLSYGETFMRLALGQLALERYGARALAQFIDINVEPGQGQQLWASQRAFGVRLAAEYGRNEEVKRALEDLASRDFAAVARDLSYLYTMAHLAEAAARVDAVEHAERLYELLAPYAGYNTPNGLLLCVGAVDHYLALLAACLGRDEAVEPHFEAALALERKMGARPRAAQTRLAHARWLCKRPDAADLLRGRELAAAVAADAEVLGMEWLARRATKLLA